MCDITIIPDIMRTNGWDTGARLMQAWFNGPSNAQPKTRYNATVVTMKWALGFSRAENEYNNLINKKMWSTTNARKEITKMLTRKRLLSEKEEEFGDDAWFEQTANHLDSDYIQQLIIGDDWTEKAGMGLREYVWWHDDMDAALANFNLRMVVGGKVRPTRYQPSQTTAVELSGEVYTASSGEALATVAQKKKVTLGELIAANPGLCNPRGGAGTTDVSGMQLKIPKPKFSSSKTADGVTQACKPTQYEVEILRVGVYVWDSYDFNGDQSLGTWAIGKESSLLGFKSREKCGVTNQSFRDWRTQNNKGGDFLVFSDVKKTVLDKPYTFIVTLSN